MKKLFLLLAVSATVLSCSGKSEMDRFVDNLMSRMSVEQKIGQLNLHSAPGFVSALKVTDEDANVKLLKAGQLGGIYGNSDVDYLRGLQEIALSSGAGIPLLFGMDIIHGHETIMPIPLALSCSWNMDLIEKTARTAAQEATATGINWVYSPMVDICRDARWGRIAEGAGEDPYLGGEIAKAYVRGYQGHDNVYDSTEVLTCVKHYALYGAAEAGRDYNSVFLSRQEALNGYMRPYEEAAKAGAASFMSSFNEFEGVPASMNDFLLDELLRGRWGFEGFVVSDATAIAEEVNHGIGDLQEVSARSLKAGLDMDMNSDGYVGTLLQSVKEGRVSVSDIDRACRRILEAKYKLGLFEDPFRHLKGTGTVYTPDAREVAYQAACESQVLLKNNGVLPLRKDARIAVIGPFADDAREMSGTWTLSSHRSECVTILDGIRSISRGPVLHARGSDIFLSGEQEENMLFSTMRAFVPGYKDREVHTVSRSRLTAEALAASRQADVVVACVGELAAMNGEGASRTDIGIPDAQRQLLEELKATGKPIVLVLTTGRPLTLVWEDENMDAILCTWAQGTEAGRAIADVLFGKVNPSGKLTTSFPRSVGQLPLYYNHKNTGRPHPDEAPYKKFVSCYTDELNAPLYPFGYGLSYTAFSYGKPRLSASSMTADGGVTLSVDVTNTGAMDGYETVQLYIRAVFSSSTRPVKELKGFRKVFLKAGETKTIDFAITPDLLKYYNHNLDFVLEPGEFQLMTGPDSRDLRSVMLTVEAK